MNAVLSGNSIRVAMGYNPDAIQALKCAPDGRRWDKVRKEWILPATMGNIRFLMDTFQLRSADLEAKLQEIERPLTASRTFDVDWQCTPFAHQVKALSLALSNDGCALFHEMGLGKTLVAIKAIEHRIKIGEITSALIVCPKTVVAAWMREFEKYSQLRPIYIGGDGKKRTQSLAKGQVCIVNYDLLQTMLAPLVTKGFGMLILDESHFVKNHTSHRSKAAYTLAQGIRYRILMTGTPITRDPSDCFSQFRILDEQIFGSSFYSFRNYYFNNHGLYYPDWQIKPGMLDEIRRKMALRSQRLLKVDALDLPDKLYQVMTVDMEPDQHRIYHEIEKQLVTEINEQTIAVTFLPTRLIRLNQICSGYLPDGEGKKVEFPHAKLKALRELIDGYDGKVVLWAVFTHDIETIAKEFEKEGILVVQGSTSMVDRQEAIWAFQEDDGRRLIVLQTATGSQGITLHAAHLSVFYSQDYNLVNKLQAQDRLHRIGQKNPVTYIDLICSGSIEQDIIESLDEKKLMAGYIQGDIQDLILARFKRRAK